MPYLPLDESLIAMIRENEAIIRGFMHCGGGDTLWDSEIAWDYHAQVTGDAWDEDAARLSHAIGFISGVAAALDVTPLELLDVVHHVLKAPGVGPPTDKAVRKSYERAALPPAKRQKTRKVRDHG